MFSLTLSDSALFWSPEILLFTLTHHSASISTSNNNFIQYQNWKKIFNSDHPLTWIPFLYDSILSLALSCLLCLRGSDHRVCWSNGNLTVCGIWVTSSWNWTILHTGQVLSQSFGILTWTIPVSLAPKLDKDVTRKENYRQTFLMNIQHQKGLYTMSKWDLF